MLQKVKVLLLILFFLIGALPRSYGQGYMHSDVWDSKNVIFTQNQLTLNASLSNGPGYFNWNVFYVDCNRIPSNPLVSYMILPKEIIIGGVAIPMGWQGNVVGEINGGWVIVANQTQNRSDQCPVIGSSGRSSLPSIHSEATADLVSLPPGVYNDVYFSYYVGSAYGDSFAEAVSNIKAHGLDGRVSTVPGQTFTGVAACAQDGPTSGSTIDFGTVTSNGSVQQGPITTLGLVCNYDVALNDVSYSLTSNNPVTGEPSTGQNVAVALTNGATVKLDGGNVTQPDPKRVSVNITPSIDTRGATAGEGAGSATLTFTYE